jgi:hypothetical protein
MKKLIVTIICIVTFFMAKAQEEGNTFGIEFSGFVKHDAFFDSRQTVTAREGHFLLWPSAELLDVNNKDINAKANFNMLALQSRLNGTISGPDAFGAKTSGVIEGDFFAQANDNINLFRLRHAFVKLSWANTSLITGQFWNPLFVTDCFPGTVSFNTGTPLQSFGRNPQVRLTHKMGGLQIVGAVLSQRDFASRGPAGISSSYLRDAAIPDMHLQLQYLLKSNETGPLILGGLGIAYKTIVPRLSSTVVISPTESRTYKVNEKMSGLTAIAYAKFVNGPITLKMQGRYGENIADVLSISGFAVKAIEDATTGEQSYTPLTNATLWGEVHTNGKTMQVGVFGGFLKNLGTKEAMSGTGNEIYGLGTNIGSLVRVSPRVIFISNKMKFACEVEYTSAAYGSNHDVNYVPGTTTTVANTRVLLSTIYSF